MIGIVLIGRNEGTRLRDCIRSVQAGASAIVYVDSGSTDGSVALARSMGVEVVELDLSVPFTAARARNAGAQRLLEQHPGTEFIQFVDGDCEVHAGWLPAARDYLQRHEQVAVVCGRRRERYPEASVYNLLCDLEWNTPCGEAREFGGDALVRASVFRSLGGYNPALIAGEEPEFSVRIRQGGWKIVRLDQEMTLHDAAMRRFGQWWNRTKRSGHALAERAYLHGAPPERDCAKERRSTLVWGLVFPLLAVASGALVNWWCLLLLPLGYGYLTYRIMSYRRSRGDSPKVALTYGLFCVLGKVPQLLGLLVFYRNRLLRRRSVLIEYKGPEADAPRANPPTASACNT